MRSILWPCATALASAAAGALAVTAYRAYVVRVGPALPAIDLRASSSEPEADEDLQLRYSWEVAELPRNVKLVRRTALASH